MSADTGRRADDGAAPAPAAHVSTAAFDGETVLYDAVRCRPVLLNVSAAAVWALLDGRQTLPEIVSAVAARFGADPAALVDDIAATLARFEELELLSHSPG